MKSVTPIAGWLLDHTVEIDGHCPGFAGHVLRSSIERRHVIAAYLAKGKPHTTFANAADQGLFLMTASHSNILSAAYGVVPRGFRGALSRSGSQPSRRWHYSYPYLLMSGSSRPATKRMISRLQRVNPTRLKVARALAADLQCASLVMALRSVDAARDLNALVNLLEQGGADRAAMVEALATVADMSEVRQFAQRWAFRVRLPRHPVPKIDGFTPIEDGSEIRRIAIRYRNCMRNYAANVLEGRSAFALVAHDGSEAVVHLVHENETWFLDDFYSRGNLTPDRHLTEHWTAYLSSHGIQPRQHRRHSSHRWASLRRLAGHMDYEPNFES